MGLCLHPQGQETFWTLRLKVESQSSPVLNITNQLLIARGYGAVGLLPWAYKGCFRMGIWNLEHSFVPRSQMPWNWIMWRGGGGRNCLLEPWALSCCSTSTIAKLGAECLFHPLRSQLDRVKYCWPHHSPAITFSSISVRHHGLRKS